VVALLQRVEDYCTVSAWVGGDASGYYFGDVAYFNALERGVKKGLAAGSMADPESQQMLGEFIEGMGALARQLEEQGYETYMDEEAPGPEAGRARFANFVEEALAAEDPAAGDNFGLSLTDVKLDTGHENSREDAMALLANAFTLTVSGRVEAPNNKRIVVNPSTVTATVGLSDEGSRIPFVLPENGDLLVEAMREGEDYIVGGVDGRLVSEGKYTIPGVAENERLWIDVNVHFTAKRGAFGCMF